MENGIKFKPNEVVVISTERKQLPFSDAKHFQQEFVEDYVEFWEKLIKYAPTSKQLADPNKDTDESKKVIIIDSFTRTLSLLSTWLEDVKKIRGYDFWKLYAKNIETILMQTMITNKWLIWTAIDDISLDSDGEVTKIVKVKGNEVKGLISSYFTVVLWTNVSKKETNMSKKYQFITNSDGTNSAKTPIGMFPDLYIPNDLSIVLQRISEHNNLDPEDFTVKRPNILIAGRSGSGKSTSLMNLLEID
jgi:hypothetical protein